MKYFVSAILYFVLCLLCLIGPCIYAQNDFTTVILGVDLFNFNILRNNPDMSSMALGSCGLAGRSTSGMTFHNPAKTVFMEDNIVLSNSHLYYNTGSEYQKPKDVFRNGTELLYKVNKKVGGGLFFHIQQNKYTTATENRFLEYYAGMSLSYQLTKNFSIGSNVKYAYSDYNNPPSFRKAYNANMTIFDLGFYYETATNWNQKTKGDFSIGMAISNLGSKAKYTGNPEGFFIPANMGIGTAYGFDFNKNYYFQIIGEVNKLLVPYRYEGLKFNLSYYGQNLFKSYFDSFTDAENGIKEEIQELIWQFGQEHRIIFPFKKRNNDYLDLTVRNGLYLEHQDKGNRRYFTHGYALSLHTQKWTYGLETVWLHSINETRLNERFGLELKVRKSL